jgi:pimeloyl-ACP methyl ester carboxylesterase
MTVQPRAHRPDGVSDRPNTILKPHLILLPGMLCDEAYFASQLPDLQLVATISVASYPNTATIAAMADAVLCRAPEQFAVAGHSMGGRVAQELVRRAPQRVTGIGLFGTDYRGIRNSEERADEQIRRRNWLALIDSQGFRHFAEQWAPLLVAPARRGDEALLAEIMTMAERFGRAGLDAHCLAGLSRPDYTDLLPRISVPVLVATGREDAIRTPALHEEMAARIPTARLAIIEGSGHMLSMEAAPAMTAAMIPWLASLAT